MMHDLALLPAVLPEIAALEKVEQSAPHHEDVLAHTISTVRRLVALEDALFRASETSPPLDAARQRLAPYAGRLRAHFARRVDGELTGQLLLRLGALFHDSGKAETQRRDDEGRIRSSGMASRGRGYDGTVARSPAEKRSACADGRRHAHAPSGRYG